MNKMIVVENVRGRLDANGNPELNLEDVARGLGFTQGKGGVSYIRWDRLEGYLRSFGFSPQVGKDTFIPENIFYKLCFKAENKTAVAFQDIVTDEILPAIRKTGTYTTDPAKQSIAEAKLRNARAREASTWLRIAQMVPIENYKQICASQASAVLAGGDALIPLPAKTEAAYSATDISEETGISAITIGKVATAAGLKTPEYGCEVWDKAKGHGKQVPSWRYNEKGRARLLELLDVGVTA